MSYYDHATLMALRLGPWDPNAGEGSRRLRRHPAGSRLRRFLASLAGNWRARPENWAARQIPQEKFTKP